MARRSAPDNSGLPPALLKSTPRQVRVNTNGRALFLIAVAIVALGIWGGIAFGTRASSAQRHLDLFASERIVTPGDVTQLRRRGGDDDYRTTAHYRYLARGEELTGTTPLRRAERDRYVVGSQVAIWYLASEPKASWLDGYAPRPQPTWPAIAVPLGCGVLAIALILAVRRQSKLLEYGRPAMATVTRVEKKKTDQGTFWMVHYKWSTLSGATRTGKYRHGKKDVPAAGMLIPIVYDRDDTLRHSKYPMSFVTIRA